VGGKIFPRGLFYIFFFLTVFFEGILFGFSESERSAGHMAFADLGADFGVTP
jgi:hypothetical protein